MPFFFFVGKSCFSHSQVLRATQISDRQQFAIKVHQFHILRVFFPFRAFSNSVRVRRLSKRRSSSEKRRKSTSRGRRRRCSSASTRWWSGCTAPFRRALKPAPSHCLARLCAAAAHRGRAPAPAPRDQTPPPLHTPPHPTPCAPRAPPRPPRRIRGRRAPRPAPRDFVCEGDFRLRPRKFRNPPPSPPGPSPAGPGGDTLAPVTRSPWPCETAEVAARVRACCLARCRCGGAVRRRTGPTSGPRLGVGRARRPRQPPE